MRGDAFRKREDNSCKYLRQPEIPWWALVVLYSQAGHLLYFFESPWIGTVWFSLVVIG